jgi:hypothetical protein
VTPEERGDEIYREICEWGKNPTPPSGSLDETAQGLMDSLVSMDVALGQVNRQLAWQENVNVDLEDDLAYARCHLRRLHAENRRLRRTVSAVSGMCAALACTCIALALLWMSL